MIGCGKVVADAFGDSREVGLPECGDEEGAERLEHEVADGVIEPVLSERHCELGGGRCDVQEVFEEFPEDVECEDHDQDLVGGVSAWRPRSFRPSNVVHGA